MLEIAIASIAPLIASAAMWRGSRRVPVAAIERIEAKVDDLLQWQVNHAREHKSHIRRVGGMQ
jgi:hypothetical protein